MAHSQLGIRPMYAGDGQEGGAVVVVVVVVVDVVEVGHDTV